MIFALSVLVIPVPPVLHPPQLFLAFIFYSKKEREEDQKVNENESEFKERERERKKEYQDLHSKTAVFTYIHRNTTLLGAAGYIEDMVGSSVVGCIAALKIFSRMSVRETTPNTLSSASVIHA